jgi:hypothetical protein
MARREAHYRRALGPVCEPGVYHFEDDGDPHVDVYVHGRTRVRPFETMITGGLADRRMPGVPPDLPLPRRVEILVKLRKAADWAAVVLRQLSQIPFEFGFPLAGGLMIEGDRPVCKGSRLRHVFLLPAVEEVRLRGLLVRGEPVSFLRLLLLTQSELDFTYQHGPFAIAEALHRAGQAILVDPRRESVV